MNLNRPVVVKYFPANVSVNHARSFLREIRPFFLADQPQLVFDLSLVEQMDSAGVEMLLECMTECMKRDGNVKLANLSYQSATVLELTRTARLFEIYGSSSEAVRSFSSFRPDVTSKGESLAA